MEHYSALIQCVTCYQSMTRCTATAMCTRRAPTPRCPPPSWPRTPGGWWRRDSSPSTKCTIMPKKDFANSTNSVSNKISMLNHYLQSTSTYLVGWKSKCSVILYYLQMWKIIGCSLIKINIDNKQQINKTEDYNFALCQTLRRRRSTFYIYIHHLFRYRTGLQINAWNGSYSIMWTKSHSYVSVPILFWQKPIYGTDLIRKLCRKMQMADWIWKPADRGPDIIDYRIQNIYSCIWSPALVTGYSKVTAVCDCHVPPSWHVTTSVTTPPSRGARVLSRACPKKVSIIKC